MNKKVTDALKGAAMGAIISAGIFALSYPLAVIMCTLSTTCKF